MSMQDFFLHVNILQIFYTKKYKKIQLHLKYDYIQDPIRFKIQLYAYFEYI